MKINLAEIDGFNTLSDLVLTEYKRYHKQRDEYIREMYLILLMSNYTRKNAVDTIYNTLADKLNSLIEVRKTHIENITKGLKVD